MEYGASGRTFVVLGDTDLESREIEFERPRLWELDARDGMDEIVGRRSAHRRARSISSMCSFQCRDRSRRRGRFIARIASNVSFGSASMSRSIFMAASVARAAAARM